MFKKEVVKDELKTFLSKLKIIQTRKNYLPHLFTKSSICNKLFWNSEEIFYSLRKLLIKSNSVIIENG